MRLRFSQRRPYLFSTLIVLMVILVYLIAGTVAHFLNLPNTSLYLIGNLILTLLTGILLSTMHLWRESGLVRPLRRPADFALFWPAFIPALVNLLFGIQAPSAAAVLVWMVLALTVGFVEEGLFRGLILHALAPRGWWRAAILSALFFGFSHSLNVLGGSSPAYVVLQVGYAIAFGFAFAAMALRSGVIWPLVIAHFLIDFAGFIAADRVGAANVDTLTLGISIIYIIAYSAYGIYLLRKAPAPVEQPV